MYHVPPWLFNVYMGVVVIEVKMGMTRRGVSFLEHGREGRLPGFSYADDLVLYGELEEDLRVMVRRFAEVCRRRRLKISPGKSKVVVLNREEGNDRKEKRKKSFRAFLLG